MAITTRTQIDAEVNYFYNKTLLVRAKPRLVHTNWGQVRDIPQNAGTNSIKFRRYAVLAANTTALDEGVTPAGKQLSKTDITATVAYYGDYVTFSDTVLTETADPLLTETADLLGDQAGLSLDQLARDILNAGTTVQYASTATSRATVDAAMKLTRDEVKEMVKTLKGNDALTITEMIDPANAYNTIPVRPCFVGIVHPNTTADLEDAEGWTPVEKYPNKGDVMAGEVGSLEGVRFVETTQAKTFTGTLIALVYSTLVIAKNAYGVTRIAGKALQNIIHPLGSAGTADPLNQRATSGWKASFVTRVLNDNFIGRIEHAVS